ncbi:hypothetical protein [Bradyrhizobium sp. RT5a]|uniref:hypothetical protein n=1 Tax=Bradyrhizobium sp. RT5a TaxID=3156380 RepID=UPI0033948041
MTDKPFVLFPGMIEPLRAARVYGYLIQYGDALYHPGGTQPICTMSLARKMVEGGWLEQHGHRYRQSRVCERPSEAVGIDETLQAKGKALF